MKYLCRAPVDIINSFRTFEFTKRGAEKEGSENGLKMAIARAPDTQRENVKSVLISIESCTGAAAAAVAAGVAVSQRQRT